MSTPPKGSQSPLEALGCGLLLIGVVGGAFGFTALLGISDRVELEFFGIELNDTLGQFIWTAGCGAAAAVGWLVLRAHRRNGSGKADRPSSRL